SASPVTRFTTPLGNPAASKILKISIADKGVSGEGFSTVVHPAARAGANFLVFIELGKFQGVMAPTTPTGLGITSILCDLTEEGSHSPSPRLAASASQSTT